MKLTEIEVKIATMVGLNRRGQSMRHGFANHGHSGIMGFDQDVDGAAAEMAYCKIRNRYWGGGVGTFKEADVGGNVQIRSTRLDHGSLIVRPDDDPEHFYVLMTGTVPDFALVGWIKGVDAKQAEFWKSPNGKPGAWFVPQGRLNRF